MVDGRKSSPQWGTEGSPLSGGGGRLNPVPCGWWLAHGRKGCLIYITHLLRQRLLVTMFPHSILSLIRCTSLPAVPLKACAARRGSVWLCASCPLHHSLAAGAGRSDRQPVICRPHSGPSRGLSPQKKGYLSLTHCWADSCPRALALAVSLCLRCLLPWHCPFIQFSDQHHHLSENSATHPISNDSPRHSLPPRPALFSSYFSSWHCVIYGMIYTSSFFLPSWNISSVRAGTLLSAVSPAPIRGPGT